MRNAIDYTGRLLIIEAPDSDWKNDRMPDDFTDLIGVRTKLRVLQSEYGDLDLVLLFFSLKRLSVDSPYPMISCVSMECNLCTSSSCSLSCTSTFFYFCLCEAFHIATVARSQCRHVPTNPCHRWPRRATCMCVLAIHSSRAHACCST